MLSCSWARDTKVGLHLAMHDSIAGFGLLMVWDNTPPQDKAKFNMGNISTCYGTFIWCRHGNELVFGQVMCYFISVLWSHQESQIIPQGSVNEPDVYKRPMNCRAVNAEFSELRIWLTSLHKSEWWVRPLLSPHVSPQRSTHRVLAQVYVTSM